MTAADRNALRLARNGILAITALLLGQGLTAHAQTGLWTHEGPTVSFGLGAVAVDSSDDIYHAVSRVVDFSLTSMVTKFDPDGNVVWSVGHPDLVDARVVDALIATVGGTEYLYVALDSLIDLVPDDFAAPEDPAPAIICLDLTDGSTVWAKSWVDLNYFAHDTHGMAFLDGELLLAAHDVILGISLTALPGGEPASGLDMVAEMGFELLDDGPGGVLPGLFPGPVDPPTDLFGGSGLPGASPATFPDNTNFLGVDVVDLDADEFNVGLPGELVDFAGVVSACATTSVDPVFTFGGVATGLRQMQVTPTGSGNRVIEAVTVAPDGSLFVYLTANLAGNDQQVLVRLNAADSHVVDWAVCWRQSAAAGDLVLDELGNVYLLTWDTHYFLLGPGVAVLLTKWDGATGASTWGEIFAHGALNEAVWGESALEIDTARQRLGFGLYTDSLHDGGGAPSGVGIVTDYDGVQQTWHLYGTAVDAPATDVAFDSDGNLVMAGGGASDAPQWVAKVGTTPLGVEPPGPTPIPTLSEWALILLGITLGIAGAVFVRARG
ncbi:MAG: IPTL-CTERM sorting domain-containing protein [Acidobacteriota bacterium]